MKKQGFTLIELLGVIVVLAIILLITIPSVLNIVEEAQKGSFQNSAYAIVRAAELKHADNVLKNKDTSVNDCGTLGYEVYKYIDGKAEDIELAFKGKRPKSGTIAIKSDGDVVLAIHNGRWCAVKEQGKSEIEIYEISEEECEKKLSTGIKYVDVRAFNEIVYALDCNGDVKIGMYYKLNNMVKISNIPKIKKLFDYGYFLGEDKALYSIDDIEDDIYDYIAGYIDDDLFSGSEISATKIYDNVKDFVAGGQDGYSHYLLLENGKVMVSGENKNYELGLGSDSDSYYDEYVELPGLSNVKKIDASISWNKNTFFSFIGRWYSKGVGV